MQTLKYELFHHSGGTCESLSSVVSIKTTSLKAPENENSTRADKSSRFNVSQKMPNKNNRWHLKVKCDTHSNLSGLRALDYHLQVLSYVHFAQ